MKNVKNIFFVGFICISGQLFSMENRFEFIEDEFGHIFKEKELSYSVLYDKEYEIKQKAEIKDYDTNQAIREKIINMKNLNDWMNDLFEENKRIFLKKEVFLKKSLEENKNILGSIKKDPLNTVVVNEKKEKMPLVLDIDVALNEENEKRRQNVLNMIKEKNELRSLKEKKIKIIPLILSSEDLKNSEDPEVKSLEDGICFTPEQKTEHIKNVKEAEHIKNVKEVNDKDKKKGCSIF